MFPSSRQSAFHQSPYPTRQFPPFQQGFHNPSSFNAGVPGRGGIQGILQKFIQPAASHGTTNGGITHTLGNIQQILKMAQSATPIIQQYGPMVKNVPMMLKMLKALNEDDSDDSKDESIDESGNQNNNKIEIQEENLNKIESKKIKQKQPKESFKEGESTPKLFI